MLARTREAIVGQLSSPSLMTEGERARIPPGAVLFFFSCLCNQGFVLNQVPRVGSALFSNQAMLSLAAWGEANFICKDWAEKKLTRKLLPFCTFERESGKRAGAWLLEEMGSWSCCVAGGGLCSRIGHRGQSQRKWGTCSEIQQLNDKRRTWLCF